MVNSRKANEIYITRLYEASASQVWKAWTDPEQLAHWWGPRGFTITTKRKEVKKGGDWLFNMHGPENMSFPNYTKYLEVEDKRHLVYDHGATPDQTPMFRVTVGFSETNGKTKMDMTMAFPSAEIANNTKSFIKQMNGDSTWDRLAEFLAKETHQKEIFSINRTFNASPEALFEAWTNPQKLMSWLPPVGFRGKFIKADITTNGENFFQMSNNEVKMFGKAHYLEVSNPTKLIYTQVFTDETGKTSRHPMAPTWPEKMQVTVLFFKESENETRVCLTSEAIGTVTPEEQQMFNNGRAGMMMGWTGSFDKLEERLRSL